MREARRMRGRRSSLNNSSEGMPVPVEPTRELAAAAMSQMRAPMAKVRRSWEKLQRFKVNFRELEARFDQYVDKCADAWGPRTSDAATPNAQMHGGRVRLMLQLQMR